MIELYNIGISEETIKTMIQIVPSITETTKKEIIDKMLILEHVGCSSTQIINIIGSNPNYLIRTNGEIFKLIECLTKLGFENLNILLESNPYILNLEPFEIENYIEKRKYNNEDLEDIIDDLDSNPLLFNEM